MKQLWPLFIFLFISCQKASPPDTIRIALSGNPPTLDWNLATDNISYQVITQLMEGLTQYDENGKTIPAIASSWEVLDEGQRFIFHINDNYKWSDGVSVNAQQFVDSWVRLLKPETASEYAYYLYDIINAKAFNEGQLITPDQLGIKALDERTLEVKLNKPLSFFPTLLSFMVTYPIRQDLIDQYGDQWTDPKNIQTCGPYILSEFWPEYRLTLKSNSSYGGAPAPQIKKISFYVVPDPTTALTLAESNLLDVALIPPLAQKTFKDNPNLTQIKKLRGYYYGFNLKQKPFDQLAFRQALALSLDKTELPLILKGGELPVDSWIPPPLLGFNNESGLHFDRIKAQELLRQAKWDTQQTLTLYFNGDATNKKVAEWAQEQWKKHLGLTVELKSMEWKAYLSLMHNEPPGFFRMGWGADYPDPDNFMNLFTSQSGNNYTNYHDSSYDALVSTAASELDPDKRKNLYDAAQKKLLVDHCVIIPLFVANQYLWVREAFRPYPATNMDFAYLKRLKLK